MTIRPLRPSDRDELVRMRGSLWPDSPASEVDDILGSPSPEGIILVVERADGRLRGFAEVGLRKFAEGCTSSPVAYLEGIWMDTDARREGVGSALVGAVEDWARSQGLAEFASDCDVENTDSRAFHLAAGFEEVQRSVCFKRSLNEVSQ